MMTHYDPELTDDEWREENFPEDVLDGARRMGYIATPDSLIRYAEKHGPDAILESAIMCGQNGYRKVEKALRKMPTQSRPARRRRVV